MVLESEGCTELAMSLTGTGMTGPAPHRIPQQESCFPHPHNPLTQKDGPTQHRRQHTVVGDSGELRAESRRDFPLACPLQQQGDRDLPLVWAKQWRWSWCRECW